MTMGVYHFANVSIIRSAEERIDCASSTNLISLEYAESTETDVTRTSMDPFWFMVPPKTLEWTFFETGFDSPVNALSSIAVEPSTTIPSRGTRAPGCTRTIASMSTDSTPTFCVVCVSLFTRSASSTRKASTALMASDVLAIARDSSHSDKVNKLTTAAASKKSCKATAPAMAIAINVFISTTRIRNDPYDFKRISGNPTAIAIKATHLKCLKTRPSSLTNCNKLAIVKKHAAKIFGPGRLAVIVCSFDVAAPPFVFFSS